jgi:hypothetical protein
MGPHWPGHSPPRETTERFSGVSPGPPECGVEPKSDDRLNPMGGVPRVQAREEVKLYLRADIEVIVLNGLSETVS